jgi:hypothetical protein
VIIALLERRINHQEYTQLLVHIDNNTANTNKKNCDFLNLGSVLPSHETTAGDDDDDDDDDDDNDDNDDNDDYDYDDHVGHMMMVIDTDHDGP